MYIPRSLPFLLTPNPDSAAHTTQTHRHQPPAATPEPVTSSHPRQPPCDALARRPEDNLPQSPCSHPEKPGTHNAAPDDDSKTLLAVPGALHFQESQDGTVRDAGWHPMGNMKRDGSMQTQNTTIGVIVGVLLAIFLAGFFYFVYRYHSSIRIRRRRSHGSSSRGSNFKHSRGSRQGSHSSAASAESAAVAAGAAGAGGN
jgi:hypothetical protein